MPPYEIHCPICDENTTSSWPNGEICDQCRNDAPEHRKLARRLDTASRWFGNDVLTIDFFDKAKEWKEDAEKWNDFISKFPNVDFRRLEYLALKEVDKEAVIDFDNNKKIVELLKKEIEIEKEHIKQNPSYKDGKCGLLLHKFQKILEGKG